MGWTLGCTDREFIYEHFPPNEDVSILHVACSSVLHLVCLIVRIRLDSLITTKNETGALTREKVAGTCSVSRHIAVGLKGNSRKPQAMITRRH